MASNKSPLTQLQRRGGRRISQPSSPIADRDRGFSEKVSQWDLSTEFDDAPGPMLDLMATEGQTLSSPVGPSSASASVNQHVLDSWTTSPPIGSPVSDAGYRSSLRASYPDGTIRSSPLSHTQQDGQDGARWTDARNRSQDRPGLASKNANATSPSVQERSLFDESSSRTTTAKKSRLNLLNPMSLLARRRSSQNAKLEDLNMSPLHVPAIPNFDPSIRGNIVHDFSTPRLRTPRREVTSKLIQRHSAEYGAPQLQSASPPTLHSPMFKEHFQEDDAALQPGQTAYLHNLHFDAVAPESLPPFAHKLPAQLPVPGGEKGASTAAQEKTQVEEPPPPPPKSTPPPVGDPYALGHLPKHMKSTSSRFSFQMSGHGSAAQEKLLEERHRERFPGGPGKLDEQNEDDYDDYDFDADDALEERIPGINADLGDEDDDFGTEERDVLALDTAAGHFDFQGEEDDWGADADIPVRNIEMSASQSHFASTEVGSDHSRQPFLLGFHFTPQSMTLSPSPTSTQHASEPTPRDSQGFPIGIADTKYSPTTFRDEGSILKQNENQGGQLYFEGLRISTGTELSHTTAHGQPSNAFDDADLYFDDGDFGMEVIESEIPFDEELLDDESHLRDIPAENARRYEEAICRSAPDHGVAGLDAMLHHSRSVLEQLPSTSTDRKVVIDTDNTQKAKVSLSAHVPSLTEDNLAAYHDALAMAATHAASEGRFNRQVSFSEGSNAPEDAPWSGSQSGPVSDEGRYSLNMGMNTFPTNDPFMFDDDADYDDDLMIAEANAEALENDDEGFYGQEFGFYARVYGREQSELLHGGYFTKRGANGIKRSHSGKANFQEPSLTPITERSEWSARNSVVSLQFHQGMLTSTQSLPSPGLAQLMDSPAIEDELSLSALMKLRRGTFGGSSTSISSLGVQSVPNSSPLAHLSNKYPQTDSSTNRMSLSHPSLPGSVSIPESEEENDDVDRPTLTQNTPRKMSTDPPPKTPEHSNNNLKVETAVTSRKGHHSRNSSGAESVSYARDDDGRWILERRRTGDDGELELIAREYLAGARI